MNISEVELDYRKYSRMLESIKEVTNSFVPIESKRIFDRQGLLFGEARSLGTFNELRACPYNESHQISEGRFRQHQMKCRENNPAKALLLIICRFDASHHVPINLYMHHLKFCRQALEATARFTANLPKP